MTISARIGSVKATHNLIEVRLSAGHIEMVFLGPNDDTEFVRRLAIQQSRELAAKLLEAAARLEEHEEERSRAR
jgi:hypothetical protein